MQLFGERKREPPNFPLRALLSSLSVLLSVPCFADFDCRQPPNCLLYDLEMARFWDEKMCETLPVTFSHLLSTGYFTTPSARMTCCGDIGVGVTDIQDSYLIWNARVQPFSHLELSANYRIFKGVDDPGLTPYGFGDYADRGANFKIALFTPEDSGNALPGIAVGIEDFMGSKKFTNYFAVATKVWMPIALETSLGYGIGRYNAGDAWGFFGGVAWYPFYDCSCPYFQNISIAAEYDPIDYSDPSAEPNPAGRLGHTHWNVGGMYSYKDILYFSASWLRGEYYALSGALSYHWGTTKGFVHKSLDPAFDATPFDHESLGCYRTTDLLAQELYFALEDQGFFLQKIWFGEDLSRECCLQKKLWLMVVNECYRHEEVVRCRLQHTLAALLPENIEEVTVIVTSYGVPCQQYTYPRWLLERYRCERIGPYEFDILSPRQEARCPPVCSSEQVFYCPETLFKCRLSPRLESFLGSSSGKFKYDLGVKANVEGIIPYNVFYELQLSYTVASSANDVGDFDRYNPSQLPNVLTDYVNYRKRQIFSTDRAYLQRSWNMGRGYFSRLAAGYFQVNYAGIAGEFLYYPVNGLLAFGVEGAALKKRRYHGLWFQSTLRQLEGTTPTYVPYTILSQAFVNAFIDIPSWKVASKLSFGKFLADDVGGRVEVTRYFDNGLRLTGWMTFTNAEDLMHGEKYYNRGIALELPLDFFSRCSHKRVWNYGLAAWLRDAGAFIPTGRELFDTINRERRW